MMGGILLPPRGVARVIGQSGVPSSVTGVTAETTLASVTAALGPNGALRVWTLWSCTNNSNTKTLIARINGVQVRSLVVTSVASRDDVFLLTVRSSSQSLVGRVISATPFANSSGTPLTLPIDTTSPVTLSLCGTLGVSTDTITLESYLVEEC